LTLILGIDEAGRGPVCGPMVLCGYMIEESKIEKLRKMGVKDSKLLAPKKRTELFAKLKRFCEDYHTIKISASEIDKLRNITNLNRIEIAKMQAIINKLQPDKVIIDSPEVNTQAFAKKIREKLDKECEIVAENFADKNHPEVGAASIIAKVTRDNEIKKLHKSHGFFGSGYSSDPATISFLKDWLKMNKDFPGFVRKSWMTAQLMKAEMRQTRIGSFAK